MITDEENNINEEVKKEIRNIVVEIFKEVCDEKWDDDQVFMLDEHLREIMAKKLDKYQVKVYGVSFEEGFD